MPDGTDRPSVAALASIAEVGAAEWDACAGGGNPFVTHAFLAALERAGAAAPETGWLPRHLVVRDGDGKVLACAPLYVKSHSYGEYVFDWSWAEAYTRAGGRYYPKLQCAVPFTPVTGPRLLVPPGPNAAEMMRLLGAAMVELVGRMGLSSAHVTFPTGAEAEVLEQEGWLRRLGYQYHWSNRDYRDFDDFLAQLSSRKRKQVRKERAAIAAQGVDISTLVGAEVTARHWDVFHRFYQATVDRKWGSAYLNRAFFEELSAGPLAGRVVLVWAEKGGVPLGAAFNMLGDDTLYGRLWGGAPAELPFLHFEACYYRALDFAIAHGLKRVEAGAQGEHKVSRGYLPVPTHSVHWIADPALRKPVERYLAHERQMLAEDMAEQAEAGPFRKG